MSLASRLDQLEARRREAEAVADVISHCPAKTATVILRAHGTCNGQTPMDDGTERPSGQTSGVSTLGSISPITATRRFIWKPISASANNPAAIVTRS